MVDDWFKTQADVDQRAKELWVALRALTASDELTLAKVDEIHNIAGKVSLLLTCSLQWLNKHFRE